MGVGVYMSECRDYRLKKVLQLKVRSPCIYHTCSELSNMYYMSAVSGSPTKICCSCYIRAPYDINVCFLYMYKDGPGIGRYVQPCIYLLRIVLPLPSDPVDASHCMLYIYVRIIDPCSCRGIPVISPHLFQTCTHMVALHFYPTLYVIAPQFFQPCSWSAFHQPVFAPQFPNFVML